MFVLFVLYVRIWYMNDDLLFFKYTMTMATEVRYLKIIFSFHSIFFRVKFKIYQKLISERIISIPQRYSQRFPIQFFFSFFYPFTKQISITPYTFMNWKFRCFFFLPSLNYKACAKLSMKYVKSIPWIFSYLRHIRKYNFLWKWYTS